MVDDLHPAGVFSSKNFLTCRNYREDTGHPPRKIDCEIIFLVDIIHISEYLKIQEELIRDDLNVPRVNTEVIIKLSRADIEFHSMKDYQGLNK